MFDVEQPYTTENDLWQFACTEIVAFPAAWLIRTVVCMTVCATAPFPLVFARIYLSKTAVVLFETNHIPTFGAMTGGAIESHKFSFVCSHRIGIVHTVATAAIGR